jgi:outer membrane receptor protein involved in Fe transport
MAACRRLRSGIRSPGSGIRAALGCGTLGCLAGIVEPLAAAPQQESESDFTPVLEEVIVTGTRIPRANLESASPVTVIDQEDILASGMTDVGALLQRLPSMSGFQMNTTINNDGNGAVYINLRGLGGSRTLVLINGRRVADPDFQTIPLAMIERIEVLKDGASAIYGADAVAGVVNVITRRDFEGVELGAQYNDWFDSAGQQVAVSLVAGAEFEKGNFIFGAEYVDQERAYQADTPWDFMQDSYYIYPEGCEKTVAAPYPQGCYPGGSSRIPEGRFRFLTQGRFIVGDPATEPYQAGLLTWDDGRDYNYAPANYLQTPYKKSNIFLATNWEVTEDIRFFAELRAGFRESAQELAPLPLTPPDPFYEGTYVIPETGETVAYTGISPDNYYLRQAIDRFNQEYGADLIYEPVIDVRRRMIEFPRRYEQSVINLQWVAGLEGSLGQYVWEVYFNQGRNDWSASSPDKFSGERLAWALGPSADLDGDGRPECYTELDDPGSLIPGCVPLNLFGGGSVIRETGEPVATSVTQDMLDYLLVDANGSGPAKAIQSGATIRGDVWDLPAGPVSAVIGYEYWRQEASWLPDSQVSIGEITGGKLQASRGQLTDNSVFLESLAPLWDNGVQNLWLKGGLRHDNWDAFDGDWTWQLGLEFQVLETLRLRGTAGTVFRVPTIWDLYAGDFRITPVVNDPCTVREGETLPANCEQPSPHGRGVQIMATSGGNPALRPETGKTLTAGLVWTPQWREHGLSVTADYWEVDLDDGIDSVGVQYILDDCYLRGNPETCALVTRDAWYGIADVRDVSLNLASFKVRGIDSELIWDYASSIGQWQANLLWTHVIERSGRAFPTDEEDDWSGTFGGAAYPDDKGYFSLKWLRNDWSVGWMVEYIGALDADTFCNCDSDGDPSNNLPDGTYIQSIDAVFYQDLVASYDLGEHGLKISAGITNLTNEPPPYIEIGFNATTDPSTYRLFGRGYYLRLAWKF